MRIWSYDDLEMMERHVLALGHLVGYSRYNRTIVLLVARQSYELYEKSFAI